MNYSKTSYVQTLVLSMVLFVCGQLLFVKAFKLFEPQIDGILFQITTRHDVMLNTSLLFSLSLALVPILTIFTWRLAHISSFRKQVACTLIILIFIVLGIVARRQEVKVYFTTIVKPTLLNNDRTSINYPIDPVNFVYYILLGLCFGCIVSYISLRKKKPKT